MLFNILISVGFALFAGIIVILPSLFMRRHPPKDMNAVYGYRTPRSMKNIDLWHEGNRYGTELMIKQGSALMVGGGVIGITLGAWNPAIAIFATMGLMILLTIVMVIKVESRLKKMEQSNEEFRQ